LQKAELDRARTEIKAPVDGVIVRNAVEQGTFVQKGTPLFVIEDTSRVEVRCNLEMDDLYWLLHKDIPLSAAGEPGQAAYQVPHTPVTVSYEMAGHKNVRYTWQGELRRYDGIGMDERTRTIPCRVVVDEPRQVHAVDTATGKTAPNAVGPPALVRGMYVTVQVHARPNVTFVEIPDLAVQPGKRVWRVRDSTLERIESVPLVELVEKPGPDGEPQEWWSVPSVESGIAAGDRLVVTPMAGMRPGMEVTEQQDAKPEPTDGSE
jgi:multidrug efflux pump subunit AcrA (membrane-fusion protein)